MRKEYSHKRLSEKLEYIERKDKQAAKNMARIARLQAQSTEEESNELQVAFDKEVGKAMDCWAFRLGVSAGKVIAAYGKNKEKEYIEKKGIGDYAQREAYERGKAALLYDMRMSEKENKKGSKKV